VCAPAGTVPAGVEPVPMTMSPVELEHERPGRALLGYRRGDVEALIEGARAGYEAVWRERADLEERLHTSQSELGRLRDVEAALRDALVTAERAAEERRAQAGREAELIVREAERRAREIVHESYAERERVRRDIERLSEHERAFRARLRGLAGEALTSLEEHERWVAAREGEAAAEAG
jgi:cell division initiation protein